MVHVLTIGSVLGLLIFFGMSSSSSAGTCFSSSAASAPTEVQNSNEDNDLIEIGAYESVYPSLQPEPTLSMPEVTSSVIELPVALLPAAAPPAINIPVDELPEHAGHVQESTANLTPVRVLPILDEKVPRPKTFPARTSYTAGSVVIVSFSNQKPLVGVIEAMHANNSFDFKFFKDGYSQQQKLFIQSREKAVLIPPVKAEKKVVYGDGYFGELTNTFHFALARLEGSGTEQLRIPLKEGEYAEPRDYKNLAHYDEPFFELLDSGGYAVKLIGFYRNDTVAILHPNDKGEKARRVYYNDLSFRSGLTLAEVLIARSRIIDPEKRNRFLNQQQTSSEIVVESPNWVSPQPSAPPQEDENETGKCVACMDAKANCAFIPCGHKSLCTHCAVTIIETTGTCPICRGSFDDALIVYD